MGQEELMNKIAELERNIAILPNRHMTNEEKCAMTTHRYGEITGRYVIYRGNRAEVDGVVYLNVEEYLKSLKKM